jgi:hypothetical protein
MHVPVRRLAEVLTGWKPQWGKDFPGAALSALENATDLFRRHKKPTRYAVRCRIVGLETENFVYKTVVGNRLLAGWGDGGPI